VIPLSARVRAASLAAALPGLRYEAAPCLLHGDPQHGNALHDADATVLSDWESVAVGPTEWDLVTIEIPCRRFGHPAQTYEEFCTEYGRDVRRWSGFAVLRDVRELRMITTNARKASAGSPGATEVHRRIEQARHEDSEALWSIL
jgi:aminoglycoside phosphotransferase (APT) family kinase protein